MRLLFLFSLATLGIGLPGYSQKVKYKELFVLLQAQNYKDAEPYLRKYLQDNDDNANAYLYMGRIFAEKSARADVLRETAQLASMADSALLYYELCRQNMDEKELRRNDDYYQEFNRRDIKTGEFGIKLSDVLLAIEKRSKEIKDRKEQALRLRQQLSNTEAAYVKAAGYFQAIQNGYAGEKEFYLRADESAVRTLDRIVECMDSVQMFFSAYKATTQQIGKTGYNHIIDARQIKNFKADGQSTTDFIDDDLKLWDYKSWAQEAKRIVETEVKPLREKLIGFDSDINNLRKKVLKDSVSVAAELGQITDKLKVNPIEKFDTKPMPLQLFKMKIAEVAYISEEVTNKKLRDSSDLIIRVQALRQEMVALSRLDSLANVMDAVDLDQEALNHQYFVTSAYGTTLVLKSMIRSLKDFADREKATKEKHLAREINALNWLVVDKDSVPLTAVNRPLAYQPLLVQPDEYTVGLKYGADSLATGYFYTITRTRKPDVRAVFPVDKVSFKKRDLPVIKCFTAKDAGSLVYYALIYSQSMVANKFPATVAKIYRSDGLSWANNYKFELAPSEILYSAETGELTIKTTSPSGDTKLVIIDKSGKMR